MAATNKLTAVAVRNLKEPGLHPDGGNLYLQVMPTGSRSWIFRYKVAGKQRSIGLGPYPAISLEAARTAAAALRAERATGTVDPLEARRAAKAEKVETEKTVVTFRTFAEDYITRHEAAWRNPKHRAQWRSTLASYVYPAIGEKGLADIDVADLRAILDPIWSSKNETAARVRGRVEVILDAARVMGLRTGENPARLRGNLDHVLPKRSKVARVEHHAAMPFGDVPGFMGRLRATNGTSARALAFCILTATRTSEAMGATWEEIDLDRAVWTLPPDRMKADREHKVPLAKQVVDMLRAARPEAAEGYVYPGQAKGRPLSNMAFLALLRRAGLGHLTAHGFRSSFRDWAAETTAHPNEVVEMALAHSIGNAVEAAYRRGDLFEKRRVLMQDWAGYCFGATADKVAVVEEPEALGSSA